MVKDIGAVQLKTLLDVSLDTLQAQHQRRPLDPMPVHLRDGSSLYALVRRDAGVLIGRANSTGRPQPTDVAAHRSAEMMDALAQLDTVDLRWRNAADKARRVTAKPIPQPMQARLLRVLQDRQVSPLGGGPAVAVDFALICATHFNLRDATEQGRFRSDLYYRINGLTVQLPPLRERTDFVELTARLLRDLNPERSVGVEPTLLARLQQHPWPGNLRQYANMLRIACVMLDADQVMLDWVHLPDDIQDDLAEHKATIQSQSAIKNKVIQVTPSAQNLQALTRQAMRQAIDNSAGNMSQAARQLGISRQTLYRRVCERRAPS